MACPYMWIGHYLIDGVDRASRQLRLLERRQQVRGPPLSDERKEDGFQLPPIGGAALVCAEAFIVRDLRAREQRAEFAELPVIDDCDQQSAIGSGEIAVGHDRRMLVAEGPGRESTHEIVGSLVRKHYELAV